MRWFQHERTGTCIVPTFLLLYLHASGVAEATRFSCIGVVGAASHDDNAVFFAALETAKL